MQSLRQRSLRGGIGEGASTRGGRRHVVVTARKPPQQNRRQLPRDEERRAQRAKRLPESGFFVMSDPKAEVISPLGGVEESDPTQRGGRYTSDFVWNTNWQEKLDLEEATRKRRAEAQARRDAGVPETPAEGPGFVGMSRLAMLNSMDVDLSEQLKPRPKKAAPPADEQQRAARPRTRGGGASSASFKPLPRQSQRWERSSKFSKRSPVGQSMGAEEDAEAAALAAEEKAEYDRLKGELVGWTLAMGGAGCAAAYGFYSADTAASYAAGAAGGLLYLRLLNRSVDAYGEGGGLGAVVGQQRLLIPVILTLGFNRWNTLAAADVGITLQLLPMLLGFFTYKAAVVAKQSSMLFGELRDGVNGTSSGASYAGGEGAAEGAAEDGAEEGSEEAEAKRMARDYRAQILRQ